MSPRSADRNTQIVHCTYIVLLHVHAHFTPIFTVVRIRGQSGSFLLRALRDEDLVGGEERKSDPGLGYKMFSVHDAIDVTRFFGGRHLSNEHE